MSAAEFANNTSNEAIQANLIMFKLRDELNRMAPWDCAHKYADLTYITSIPTTPENTGPAPPMWQPGIPPPPWAYEYQYPVDCLRAIKIMPQYTSLAGGTPIYPPGTSTGFNSGMWTGPALKFRVATDAFFAVTAAAPSAGGTGYVVGEVITLVQPSYTFVQGGTPFTMPVGAPAQLQVSSVGGGGAITAVTVVNVVGGATEGGGTPIGGSYFAPASSPVAQSSTTGVGAGATFSLTFAPTATPQRVILCNLESPILCYNTQVIDPNVMDVLFQDAWIHILAARLCFQLNGDKALANQLVGLANTAVMEARKVDGNEGPEVNDVTPDFIRIRGNWAGPNFEFSPNMSYDWGSFFSPY
jgi:hypothetical protein